MTSPDTVAGLPANAFGSVLRELREQAGLTQEELAERAGLTSYAVGSLERGRRQRPYPHTVRSLADALAATDEQRSRLVRAVPRRASLASADETASRPDIVVAHGPQPQPAPLRVATPLLGRDRELEALCDLVRSGGQRLLTLTGIGGVGKTRLAMELASELVDAFPDGTVVVPLAALSDPAMVMPAVARAVGCAVSEGPEADQQLAEHLAPLRLLLVLDNLEHLIAAADRVGGLVTRVHGSSRSSPAGRRCACGARSSCPCRPWPSRGRGPATPLRWPPGRPSPSSSTGPGRCRRVLRSRPATPPRWPTCAAGWPGSRWRSSWQPPGSASSTHRPSWRGSTTPWPAPAAPTCRPASAPCA